MTTKRLEVFLTAEDEKEFSTMLQVGRPSLVFLDGSSWETELETKRSVSECSAFTIYLWDRAAFSEIPTSRRADGTLQGPKAGVVIQFMRSRLEGNQLLSGRLAAGFEPEDEVMANFARDVWRVAREVCSERLARGGFGDLPNEDAPPTQYRAGKHAAERHRCGELELWAVNASVHFEPIR